MRDDEITPLWLGATRYYLGRMTYAVSDFCGMLIRAWSVLPEETKELIQRNIEREFVRDDELRGKGVSVVCQPLGHDIDRAEWEKVRKLWT